MATCASSTLAIGMDIYRPKTYYMHGHYLRAGNRHGKPDTSNMLAEVNY